jgi:DEAD/DEAH box helicase domain-containing protein
VVVATPTASGKSLCYHLPVLDALARSPRACALYLFPTKALARDQEESVRGWLTATGLSHGAVTYDGDTPGDARRAARARSGIVITNPDMLHAGIMPHHAGWARLFAELRYVVVDELHTYRGVFGSHLSNVLRRLGRIARFHGSRPQFIFASATIGNPQEHATRMRGREVALVGESGAPQYAGVTQ